MKNTLKYWFVILSLTLLTVLLYWYLYISHTPEKVHGRSIAFPDPISSWTAEDVNYDMDALSSLDPDTIVYKTYRAPGTFPVTVFIAVYETLEKADLSHSPIVCFTGQGWEITDTSKVEIPVPGITNRKLEVNRLLQKKGNMIMVTLYWYESREHAYYNRGIQKLYLFINKLRGRSDRNAFVRVIASSPIDGDINVLERDLHRFVVDAYPLLRRFLFEG